MKKLIYTIILFCSVMFVSCENACDVKEDITQLKSYRSELRRMNEMTADSLESRQKEAIRLDEKLKELHIYESGRTPQYILKIKLKQSHSIFSDLDEHLKDAMNAIVFEMPVDKDFYRQVSIGTSIVDEFRMGSFILSGSMGSWEMTVENKEIR